MAEVKSSKNVNKEETAIETQAEDFECLRCVRYTVCKEHKECAAYEAWW